MKKSVYFLLLSGILLTACQPKSNDYERLQAERDSLASVQQRMQAEIDSYFATMNQIELNIEKIKNAEKVIALQPYGIETDIDTRNKINDDLIYINEMLKANRDEINLLKERIQRSSFRSAELERSITRLTNALEAETAKVKELQLQIARKDSIIYQLADNIEVLNTNIEELENRAQEQHQKIREQDESIHTAWYVFGNKSELREQNIITPDGWFRPDRVLDSDFNKNYFVRIDARKTRSIPLYSSKAKILSTHPKSSYALEKTNGSFTLLITDTQDFWRISRYLVIEVD